MSKTIAIMQPTYLPWIGYLAMIDRVDEFVFLDCVQFEHRSWQQRNQIKSANGALWLTVPAQVKGNRDALISEMKIADVDKSLAKHVAALTQNYSKAPFFKTYAPGLFAVMTGTAPQGLGVMNMAVIRWACEVFGISTPILAASELGAEGRKADLLADICVRRDAGQYLSAPGSKAYIDDSDAFARAGVAVSYHLYDHPVYAQMYPPFLPYMSFVDLLFNVGGPEGLPVLRQGVSHEGVSHG